MCQRDAAWPLCAGDGRAHPVVAPRLDEARSEMSTAYSRYREQAAREDLHRRTPRMVSVLFLGWEQFFTLARESGSLTPSEAEGYRVRAWSALIQVARRQAEHQREAHPVDRFLRLLRAALGTGRAHVATRDGAAPGGSLGLVST